MSSQRQLKEAVLWDKTGEGTVKCKLCHHRCTISDGKKGYCSVRQNEGGALYSLNYDKICAAASDPIEKKPLFHFLPGTKSFSISAPGCNFHCVFCQNWQISGAAKSGNIDGRDYSPEEIVDAAEKNGCRSIAYTYTEPTVFMELSSDCGRIARQSGIANIFVSNGFMTPKAVEFAADFLDAINIDLKSFSSDFYSRLCGAKLDGVLETITYIAENTDIWMEITTLIVPGENDSDRELRVLAEFIAEKAGPDVPWHISRFFPNYEMLNSAPTPIETLERAYSIGKQAGLRYVYMGNAWGNGYESTYCPECGAVLIERSGYRISANLLDNGKCPKCSSKAAGVW